MTCVSVSSERIKNKAARHSMIQSRTIRSSKIKSSRLELRLSRIKRHGFPNGTRNFGIQVRGTSLGNGRSDHAIGFGI